MKKLSTLARVFLAGWLLNLLWENLHVFLYEHYREMFFSQISQIDKFLILLRASVFDAAFITAVVFVIMLIPWLKGKESWFIFGTAMSFSVWLEIYALDTGRWAYNVWMPIIPILNVGLSPSIQLGITGYLAYRLVFRHRFLTGLI